MLRSSFLVKGGSFKMISYNVNSHQFNFRYFSSQNLLQTHSLYLRRYTKIPRINRIYDLIALAYFLEESYHRSADDFDSYIKNIVSIALDVECVEDILAADQHVRLSCSLSYIDELFSTRTIIQVTDELCAEISRFCGMVDLMSARQASVDIVGETEIIQGNTVLKGGTSSSASTHNAAKTHDKLHSDVFKIANDYAICRQSQMAYKWACGLLFIFALMDLTLKRLIEITNFVRS